MKKVTVSLNSIDKVKKFVQITTKHMAEFDLCSGRYLVDGKSIMGIFSMNLSTPIELIINGNSKKEIESALEDLKEFIID